VKIKPILYSLLLFAFLLAGCSQEGPDIDVESAIPVSVTTVEPGPISEYVFATGTVEATQEAQLRAEQAGYYHLNKNPRTGQPFAMGDAVKEGDVIVTFSNRELENQIAVDSKKLNFEISQREYEKQKDLYDKGGVTLRELTDAERTFIDARYAYNNAVLQLDKLKVKAPFDGILADLEYYSPDQYVDANSSIGSVMNYRRLYCDITLPGSEMSSVAVDQPVRVSNYTTPEDTLDGSVSQSSPTLDPTSRTFKARVLIQNDSLLLRPGMFVKLDIVVDHKDSAIVIPQDVIREERGSKRVFVVDQGLAIERKIDVGISNPREVEVQSGLEAGDRLVTKGFETLRHRSKVKVLN
jgi:membrane fusion protein (multidrug efflux system)